VQRSTAPRAARPRRHAGGRPDRPAARRIGVIGAALVVGIGGVRTGTAGEFSANVDVATELRLFPDAPQFAQQFDTFQPSAALTGDLRYSSDDRRHQLVFVPFARLDGQDDERTHADVREGYYRYAGDAFEVRVGAGKVFWGVTESRHLVDIINQTDAVEDIDEEDKLGQPMVQLSLLKDWGKVDLFVMPLFRERTFPGPAGRLRFEPRVDASRARYEDAAEATHTDFALRYSHYAGRFDFGVNLFAGTSREPLFVPEFTDAGAIVFAPLYTQINQFGVDVQYTGGAWLWKLETIVREGQGDTFAALVGGFEYTLFGVTEQGADLGLLVEYLYDGRELFTAPVVTLENDLFYGTRFALNDINDTSVLAGAITDLDDGSTAALIEAGRRVGQHWRAEFEARLFVGVDDTNILQPFSRDSFFTLRLTRYF
jgi:hypothetical protein